MGFKNFNFLAIDFVPIHLLECRLQIVGGFKADLAPSTANALMRIRIGDAATLAEEILQIAPAAS